MMKNLCILIICFLTSTVMSAQERLSKEEKARREKNVQAANPFAKLGSKAKVATLSKGKYLEVQDIDSIVTIGTVRFHVDKGEIVGSIQKDTTDADAQPIGDVASRWISPDPLSEENPDWSPYRYGFDNPVRYTDPTGMLEDVYITGEESDKAFAQLQAATSLTLTRDEVTGRVTAKGEATTDADKKLQEATTDSSVTVVVNAVKENTVLTANGIKTFDGDAFMGSTVNSDGTVTTNQTVNPATAAIIDDVSGQPKGTVTKHAVLEAFIGGKENPGSGDQTVSPTVYKTSHDGANALEPNRNPAGAIINTQGTKRVITNAAGKSRVLYDKEKELKKAKK